MLYAVCVATNGFEASRSILNVLSIPTNSDEANHSQYEWRQSLCLRMQSLCAACLFLASHLSQRWQPTLTTNDRSRSWYYPRWLSSRYLAGALPGNMLQRGQPGEMRSLQARLLSHADNTERRAIHTTEGPRWTKSSQSDCVAWDIGPPRGLPATTNLALHFCRLINRYAMHSVPVQALLTVTSAGAKWRRTHHPPPPPTRSIYAWPAGRCLTRRHLTKNKARTQACAAILFSQNYPRSWRLGGTVI